MAQLCFNIENQIIYYSYKILYKIYIISCQGSIPFIVHDKIEIIIILKLLILSCYMMTKHLTTTHDFFY